MHDAPSRPPIIRISGQPGVALDDLVYIMTRLARQAEEEGFDKIFAAAEEATNVMKVRQVIFILRHRFDQRRGVLPIW